MWTGGIRIRLIIHLMIVAQTYWVTAIHEKRIHLTTFFKIFFLPFLHPSSSPLSISRKRGLSGNQGRMRSCRIAGINVVDSRMGQCSSFPRTSLCDQTCQISTLYLWQLILFVFGIYLRPITCPVKMPPVMKTEVPIPMAPRNAVGAISPK